jgi:hypothetical protein
MRSLTVGSAAIEGATGSVAPVAGVLLLGQSFLSRFKSWSIDNARQALVLEPQEGVQVAPAVTPKQIESRAMRRFRITENADNGYLNLRSGPGVTYGVIAQMPVGTTGLIGNYVPLDGGYVPFCEVEWNGQRGWASSCCMAELGQPTPVQAPPQRQIQLDRREQCKGKAKGANRLRVQQVCELDQ